ncbi:alpha/beta hydrolase [Actinokineospora inagensis]|uniref:alpha/beta hydrolase n=1 Tax=Actinokineospora inagensis TaxID=103730 RepID=UPI000412B323|nr:alpha/beta hydrolase [Actinokineospora inagensis]
MSPHTEFPVPTGLRVRGTVVVVPGRGETRATYVRFATRLAADAYQVRVVDPPQLDEDASQRFAAGLGESVDDVVRPLVLVGADSGAAMLAGLADVPWTADALVLAGLPGHAATVEDWTDELDVRTSCPVHREVLTGDPGVARGALRSTLPDTLTSVSTDLPVLVLIGDEDPLADRAALAEAVAGLPRARLSVVRGAHHDVLNDRQHRSVAAEVVSFLETLGNGLVPVITVESSSW